MSQNDDLISRQEAVDAYGDWYVEEGTTEGFIGTVKQLLESLPPAQPERKIGRWVSQKGGGYCCSECGRYALDEVDGNFIHIAFESNFCPYCGADMRGKTIGKVD